MRSRLLLLFLLAARASFAQIDDSLFIDTLNDDGRLYRAFAYAEKMQEEAKHDTIPYQQHLDKATAFHVQGVAVRYYNADTATQQLSLDVDLYYSKKALSKMTHAFRSDTSLPSIFENDGRHSGVTFSFGKMTFKWNDKVKAFISEDSLPLLSINGKKVNKYVEGRVMLETKRSGNVLTVYLKNGTAWYTFTYANGTMLAYSSDESMNKLSCKRWGRELKTKEGWGRYKYTLGSPNELTLLMKKVRRAGESEKNSH